MAASALMPRMATAVIAAVAILFAIVSANGATDGRRVALVIGNSNYSAVPTLPNPANDAADVAAALTEVGFVVTRLQDLDALGLRRALRDFEDEASGATIAMVYYAGHGIEVDGTNYLIPVDAELKRDSYVQDEAVPLDRVLSAVEGASTLKLVIVDACRNNPFANTMARSAGKRAIGRGLARVEPTGQTLVAYAAKGGTTADDGDGRNSPYAAALLANIKTPGLEINFLFRRVRDEVLSTTGGRQEPFVYGSLGSTPIYFVPGSEPEPDNKSNQKTVVVAPTGDSEMAAAYDRVERINTVDAWDTFLQYCAGGDSGSIYCGLAKAARQKLVDSSGAATAPTETSGSTTPTVKTAALKTDEPVRGDAAAECDRLAAHADDADKPAAVIGSDLDALFGNAARAIKACTTAVDDNPDNRRFAFQLGRAMHAGKRYDEAMSWYEKSAAAGSAAAMSNIGFLYATGAGVEIDYAQARDWYEKAANAGNSAAMANIAFLYEAGNGVAQDFGEARVWYQKAVDLGNPAAMNALGVLYRNGAGGTQDYAQARQLFERASEAGNSQALVNLGGMYNYGQGVPVDFKEAWRLYDKAAALGNSTAMASIGLLYENGQGLNRDFVEARKWYEKAANLGDPIAMANLGLLYQNGSGVTQDFIAARKWYEKAAALGNAPAMSNIGLMYDNGWGVPVDLAVARDWYQKAANLGNPPAMTFLGYMLANGRGGPVDYQAAIEWYEKGSAAGNAAAMTNLGYMYANGWGVQQNWLTARKWYEKGAEGGNVIGMSNLGLMYEEGQGIAQDDRQAFYWYKRGADAGNAASMASLGLFYANGRGTAQDAALAADWYTKAANLGNAMAMHNLGVAYQDGLGVPRDYNRAAEFFVAAMQQRNSWTFDQFRDNPTAYPDEVRRNVQRYLIDQGYLTGNADGVMGPASKRALDAYQQALGG